MQGCIWKVRIRELGLSGFVLKDQPASSNPMLVKKIIADQEQEE